MCAAIAADGVGFPWSPYVLAKLERGMPLRRTVLPPAVIDQALQAVHNSDVGALRLKPISSWDRQDFVSVANYLSSKIDSSLAIVVVEDFIQALPASSGLVSGGVLRGSLDPGANKL